jgi:hypothetical protein
MRGSLLQRAVRAVATLCICLALASCTGPGINAGDDGGPAFIALFGTLATGVFLFWFFLGRGE